MSTKDGDTSLWITDGTAGGTRRFLDINPGGNDHVSYTAKLDGDLSFTAGDGVHGRELWRTDGTPAGTKLLKDLEPGAGDGPASSLMNIGGRLYWRGTTTALGFEMFVSDGTPAGTKVLKDINPGSAGSAPNDRRQGAVGVRRQAGRHEDAQEHRQLRGAVARPARLWSTRRPDPGVAPSGRLTTPLGGRHVDQDPARRRTWHAGEVRHSPAAGTPQRAGEERHSPAASSRGHAPLTAWRRPPR